MVQRRKIYRGESEMPSVKFLGGKKRNRKAIVVVMIKQTEQ